MSKEKKPSPRKKKAQKSMKELTDELQKRLGEDSGVTREEFDEALKKMLQVKKPKDR